MLEPEEPALYPRQKAAHRVAHTACPAITEPKPLSPIQALSDSICGSSLFHPALVQLFEL